MDNYRVELLQSALTDIAAAIRYITDELLNPQAAQLLAERFFSEAEKLSEFPYAHPVYLPVRPLKYEYRKVPIENYLLFYRVDERAKLVTVARVVYAKRNMTRQFKKEEIK